MTVLTRPRPRCSTADEITVDRLDVARAMDRLDEIVAAYIEVYAPTGNPFFGEERFRLQLAGHMGSPAWELDCAEVDGELVGFVCGFALPATTSWWRGLETKVPRGFTGEDGHRTLAISHVVVRAPWRRRHVARRLHDCLLSGRSEQRATVLVEPGNRPAQAAYAAWGWHKAAELRPVWESAPLYDLLVLDR